MADLWIGRGARGGGYTALMTPVEHLRFQIDARLVWFVVALLGMDTFFIAIYSIGGLVGESYGEKFSSLGDWSYAEMFGYLKTMMILFLLISISEVRKRPIYLVFVAIFAFVLVDDALRVHERVGGYLVKEFNLPSFGGLRPQDSGELLVWTIVGAPLIGAAAAVVVRSPKEDRRNGLLLLAALAALGVFAVVVDMAHVAVMGASWVVRGFFGVLEDGGEQFVLSLICGLAILIRRDTAARAGIPLRPDAKTG